MSSYRCNTQGLWHCNICRTGTKAALGEWWFLNDMAGIHSVVPSSMWHELWNWIRTWVPTALQLAFNSVCSSKDNALVIPASYGPYLLCGTWAEAISGWCQVRLVLPGVQGQIRAANQKADCVVQYPVRWGADWICRQQNHPSQRGLE